MRQVAILHPFSSRRNVFLVLVLRFGIEQVVKLLSVGSLRCDFARCWGYGFSRIAMCVTPIFCTLYVARLCR